MKTIFLSFVACICLNICVYAQTRILSVDEVAQAWSKGLYPESLQAVKWRANTNEITYIQKFTELISISLGNKIPEILLDCKTINPVLKSNGISEIDRFFSFEWQNENSVILSEANWILQYNLVNKQKEVLIQLPENAENIKFCKENKTAAYTIDNNLFIINEQNKITALTNDENKNIVNGSSVSRNEFGINGGIFWSPSGTNLAFYRKDESKVSDYPLVDVTQRVAKLRYSKYPMAGMPSERVTLGVYNVVSGKTIFIENDSTSEKYLTNITWSPDEKYIYIAVLNREQNHLKLNKYNASTGSLVKTLFEEKNEKYVEPLHPLLFLKTKPSQFIWQSRRDGWNHAYLCDTAGHLLNKITSGKWEITSILGFDTKEQNMYYISTEVSPIERHIYQINLKTAKKQKISDYGGVHDGILSSNSEYLIDIFSGLKNPNITQVIDTKGGLRKILLEAKNPLRDYTLPVPEIFTIKADDDSTELYCRLIKPLKIIPNKKYPVIVYVYGGPHAQLITREWLGGARLWDIFMAQNDYVVFTIDNRGSENRGFDFESVTHRNLGQAEMADQIKGIEYLKTLNYTDMSRVGVYGWSYGGYMTISLMLNYPEIFKAGVAGGPVCDWRFYEVMYGERYMDTPQENPKGYERTSTLNKVRNLSGKLLVIHGGQDVTCVWQHSLSFIDECIKAGKLVDYFVYPRSEHGVRGRDNIHLQRKITSYFDENLK